LEMGSFWDPRKAKKKPKCKKAAREHFARPPSAGRLPQIRPFSGKGPLRASFRAPWGPPGHPSGAPGTPKMMLSLKEFDDFHFFTVFRVCPPKSEKKTLRARPFRRKCFLGGPRLYPGRPGGSQKWPYFGRTRVREAGEKEHAKKARKKTKKAQNGAMRGAAGRGGRVNPRGLQISQNSCKSFAHFWHF
jgi:hypothetical protein